MSDQRCPNRTSCDTGAMCLKCGECREHCDCMARELLAGRVTDSEQPISAGARGADSSYASSTPPPSALLVEAADWVAEYTGKCRSAGKSGHSCLECRLRATAAQSDLPTPDDMASEIMRLQGELAEARAAGSGPDDSCDARTHLAELLKIMDVWVEAHEDGMGHLTEEARLLTRPARGYLRAAAPVDVAGWLRGHCCNVRTSRTCTPKQMKLGTGCWPCTLAATWEESRVRGGGE